VTGVLRQYFQGIELIQWFCRWTLERFQTLIDLYLPEPEILHPYPLERFCAKYPR